MSDFSWFLSSRGFIYVYMLQHDVNACVLQCCISVLQILFHVSSLSFVFWSKFFALKKCTKCIALISPISMRYM